MPHSPQALAQRQPAPPVGTVGRRLPPSALEQQRRQAWGRSVGDLVRQQWKQLQRED